MTSFRSRFDDAMEDDLNTADAISVVFELIREINTAVRDGASRNLQENVSVCWKN